MTSFIQQETVACAACGSANHTVIASGTDREYFTSDDQFTAVSCDACGLLYLNPRPTAQELSRIYPPAYHSYILDESIGSKNSFITRMRQQAALRRFAPIIDSVRSLSHIDLLDVGCGNGWGLQLFKLLAPGRIRTFGVELSDAACRIANRNGHVTYCGRFEDIVLDLNFDVINITHVIEHVSNPRAVIKKAYASLKPGGVLAIETPNIDSIDGHWFRAGNWGAYHFPRHWYFFTPQSLRAMAESEQFECLGMRYHTSPTTWVWTFNNLCRAHNGWAARIGRKIFDPVAIFGGGILPTLAMSGCFLLDLTLLTLFKKSSTMTMLFRKPVVCHVS